MVHAVIYVLKFYSYILTILFATDLLKNAFIYLDFIIWIKYN